MSQLNLDVVFLCWPIGNSELANSFAITRRSRAFAAIFVKTLMDVQSAVTSWSKF